MNAPAFLSGMAAVLDDSPIYVAPKNCFDIAEDNLLDIARRTRHALIAIEAGAVTAAEARQIADDTTAKELAA